MGAILTIHGKQRYGLTAWTLTLVLTAGYANGSKESNNAIVRLSRKERKKFVDDHANVWPDDARNRQRTNG